MTSEQQAILSAELAELEGPQRQAAIETIARAREEGDLSRLSPAMVSPRVQLRRIELTEQLAPALLLAKEYGDWARRRTEADYGISLDAETERGLSIAKKGPRSRPEKPGRGGLQVRVVLVGIDCAGHSRSPQLRVGRRHEQVLLSAAAGQVMLYACSPSHNDASSASATSQILRR